MEKLKSESWEVNMLEFTIYYPVAKLPDEPSGDKVRVKFVLPKRPFLWWADYKIAESIKFPLGYGIAHYNEDKAKLLFAPIPFNIFVGFSIWLWHWLRIGSAIWFHRHRFMNDGSG